MGDEEACRTTPQASEKDLEERRLAHLASSATRRAKQKNGKGGPSGAEAGDRVVIRTTQSGTHEDDLQGAKSSCARVE
jgi:hypothetical protein